MKWFDKRYHSLNYFFRNSFGQKIAKISLNAGLSCPNRDGTLSYDGCIFCGEGSGYFQELKGLSISEQFYEYKKKIDIKWPNIKYVAYFQAFTNTYGNIDYLRKIYFEAAQIKNVIGISIATRPDCLNKDVLNLLEELRKKIYVFVELGFQTSKKASILLINRCYENQIYIDAVEKLKNININVITHVIVGIPFETKDDILNTIKFVQLTKTDGIKLQLLHVVKNTKLCQMYSLRQFEVLSLEEYTDIIVSCLEILSPEIVIHRINGDCPSEYLVAPLYCNNKRNILNLVDKKLSNQNTWQGKLYVP